jgi:hypothetical protein
VGKKEVVARKNLRKQNIFKELDEDRKKKKDKTCPLLRKLHFIVETEGGDNEVKILSISQEI